MDKILIIDDEAPTLTMFRLILGAYGYTVFTAQNGKEGLAIFEKEKPTLVLTDIKMPGIDGIEVLKRIKKLDPETQVIVITGHGDMDLAVKALNLDATDFINKPIQRQTLDHALKRAEIRRQLAADRARVVSVDTQDDAVVIKIRGSVTTQHETLLKNACDSALARDKPKVVLDFDDNASISGAGLDILSHILETGKAQGRQFVITGLQENFKNLFEQVGLADFIEE